MSEIVLAVLDHPAEARAILLAARAVARLIGARVEALVVREPPEASILPTEEILTRAERITLEAAEQQRIATLRAAFDAWVSAAGSGPTGATWSEETGSAGDIVAGRGRGAAMTVVGRTTSQHGLTSRGAMHAALFQTDRPVLVAPKALRQPLGRCVAIAWKDDSRAVKAVQAALPILRQATAVFVLAGTRQGAVPPALPQVLVEHGVTAELRLLPPGPRGSFGADLLAAAREAGADLLVMGAYAHSPLGEFIQGGVTRHVLAEADIAVLMQH